MVIEIPEGDWGDLLSRMNRDRFVEVMRVTQSGRVKRTIISTYGIDCYEEEDEVFD